MHAANDSIVLSFVLPRSFELGQLTYGRFCGQRMSCGVIVIWDFSDIPDDI